MQAGNDATAGSGKRPADAVGGARVLKRRRPDGAEDPFHDLVSKLLSGTLLRLHIADQYTLCT